MSGSREHQVLRHGPTHWNHNLGSVGLSSVLVRLTVRVVPARSISHSPPLLWSMTRKRSSRGVLTCRSTPSCDRRTHVRRRRVAVRGQGDPCELERPGLPTRPFALEQSTSRSSCPGRPGATAAVQSWARGALTTSSGVIESGNGFGSSGGGHRGDGLDRSRVPAPPAPGRVWVSADDSGAHRDHDRRPWPRRTSRAVRRWLLRARARIASRSTAGGVSPVDDLTGRAGQSLVQGHDVASSAGRADRRAYRFAEQLGQPADRCVAVALHGAGRHARASRRSGPRSCPRSTGAPSPRADAGAGSAPRSTRARARPRHPSGRPRPARRASSAATRGRNASATTSTDWFTTTLRA